MERFGTSYDFWSSVLDDHVKSRVGSLTADKRVRREKRKEVKCIIFAWRLSSCVGSRPSPLYRRSQRQDGDTSSLHIVWFFFTD